jgi:hypothetical protein
VAEGRFLLIDVGERAPYIDVRKRTQPNPPVSGEDFVDKASADIIGNRQRPRYFLGSNYVQEAAFEMQPKANVTQT